MATDNKQPDKSNPNPILVDTSGPIQKAPAADTFGVGARDGNQVVAERKTRAVGEWRDRNRTAIK